MQAISWPTEALMLGNLMMLASGSRVFLPSAAKAAPLMAILSASEPPAVKTISSGDAPIAAATRSRARSMSRRTSRPNECMLEGLPYLSVKYGIMASMTSRLTGVVAALSR